ncbi:MAG: endonuclease NucS [Chitinophagaceae bacterium]|nr:endonuclease NucS [Chitinophagaceae bacterium]
MFVSHFKLDTDVNESKKLIVAFRKLDKEQQHNLIKSAEITQPIKIQGSITLQLFGLTPTLKFESNQIKLINEKRAVEQITKVYKTLKYIDYSTFEDWFNYMGNIETEVVEKEILDYYVSVGKEDKAKQFIELEDDIERKTTLEEQLYKLMNEKLVEDILEKNLSLLGEKNLKLLKEGRQYKTDVSYIDLLCKDDKGYVVLELKKGRTEDEAVGQVLRYMGWVRDNLSPNQQVRGMIIVAFEGITEKLKKAIRGIQRDDDLIKLKQIDINLSSSEVKNINV